MVNWLQRQVQRFPLAAYLFLVFGLLWLLFLAVRETVSPLVAVLIGSWLPNVVALLVTWVAYGRAGPRRLFHRAAQWRFGAQWYAIALLGPGILALLARGAHRLAGHTLPGFAPVEAILPILLAAAFTGAMGEELGWRGTALPLLQARHSALVSALVLGIVWGLYHVPAWLLPGTPQTQVPFLAFLVGAVPLTVFISWVVNRTGGSLIAAFLAHLAFNYWGNIAGIAGDPALFRLHVAVWWLAALAIVALDRAQFIAPATRAAHIHTGVERGRSRTSSAGN